MVLPGDLGKVFGLGAVLVHVLHAGVTEHLHGTAMIIGEGGMTSVGNAT